MQKYDEAMEKGVKCVDKYLKSLKLKAWYRCCQYKWKKPRKEEMWTTICLVAPKIAKRYKEVPDVVKGFLLKPKKFHARASKGGPEGSSTIIPAEFRHILGAAIVAQLRPLFWITHA